MYDVRLPTIYDVCMFRAHEKIRSDNFHMNWKHRVGRYFTTFERWDHRRSMNRKKISVGGAGHRSRYHSHAKRGLYHLSYAPRRTLTIEVCPFERTPMARTICRVDQKEKSINCRGVHGYATCTFRAVAERCSLFINSGVESELGQESPFPR